MALDNMKRIIDADIVRIMVCGVRGIDMTDREIKVDTKLFKSEAFEMIHLQLTFMDKGKKKKSFGNCGVSRDIILFKEENYSFIHLRQLIRDHLKPLCGGYTPLSYEDEFPPLVKSK